MRNKSSFHFFVLVLGIVLSADAFANTPCTPIDLRNESLGEVRNQNNIGWCYAYATADLFAHKFNLTRVSAADIAVTYNHSVLPKISEGTMSFISNCSSLNK
jgi:hypothetical protein